MKKVSSENTKNAILIYGALKNRPDVAEFDNRTLKFYY